MKGLVFTEFFDMVENIFGEDMVDLLIDNTSPKSLGAYTTGGSYHYQEFDNMLEELCTQTNMDREYLLTAFGKHLGAQFACRYPHFFDNARDTVSLLKRLDRHVHVEVAKFQPDAELPKLDFKRLDDTSSVLRYSSPRALADLAHGLILQVTHHYNENFEIAVKKWQADGQFFAEFELLKVPTSRSLVEQIQ